MSKTYTAKEMREFANYNDAAYARNPGLYSSAVSAALRQAADAMEREEKREKKRKKYEYSILLMSGSVSSIHESAKPKREGIKVRRPVGEWEEVKDEN